MRALLQFFTGGTALASASRELARKDIPSVHLVTTFDSGGSSAKLRHSFAIPAMGDLRNRLLALADPHIPPGVLNLCASRLPENAEASNLLRSLGDSRSRVWRDLPGEYARILKRNLNFFLERMKPDFDASGACLGNLFLTGAYLEHGRDFGPALAIFHNLLRCRGTVLPIVEESFFLGARLVNGQIIVGQHLFKNLPSPVEKIFLTVHERRAEECPCRPPLPGVDAIHIDRAAVICYPPGSFYSSVLANLLPAGVGRAVARARGVKVFIPNSGEDPELCGLDISGQAASIIHYLQIDAPYAKPRDLLHFALVDSKNGRYPGGLGPKMIRKLEEMGLKVIDRDMVCHDDPRRHEPGALIRALLELKRNDWPFPD